MEPPQNHSERTDKHDDDLQKVQLEAVEKGATPDWDKVPLTTTWERWAYYLYYNGNNGVNNYAYVPLVVQYLATKAGWNPNDPTRQTACDVNDMSQPCVVPFGATSINVSAMILFVTALGFFLQAILLTTIGSLADYGNNGPRILFWVTIISCAAQILFLVLKEPWEWALAVVVALVVYISYGASLVFYAAIFPSLALNEKVYRDARRAGAPEAELADIETRRRNHISSISTAWSNWGYLMISLLLIAVYLLPDQNYANNVASAVCGAFWLINAIPWFFLEKKRPGPPLPEGTSYLTQGWIQVIAAFREARKLSQCFLYLLGYFMLSDAVNTTGSVVSVVQNKVISYSGYQLTLFGVCGAFTSAIGCYLFLYVQKWTGWSTKTMLQISNWTTLAIPIYGSIGLATSLNVGYKNVWEFWLYQVWFGIFTAPFYAYTQTMMSELIPAGRENMFFALFGIANRVSSFIGPIIIGAVIDATNIEWSGFPICAFLQLIPILIIGSVNMTKANEEKAVYEQKDSIRGFGENDDLSSVKAPEKS